MATLNAESIGDLVAGSLRELGRLKFSQIAQNLQDYVVMSQWFKKEKVVLDEGYGIQRNLISKLAGAASHVGLADADNVNVKDLCDQLQAPWRHAQTNWGVFYHEALMNRGKALVFNVMVPRRAGALIDLAEELEDKAWSAAPSSSDTRLPWGVLYWIVKNATTGFNGGAASGHTTVGNVSLTDSPNFKNYTDTYSVLSKADLVKRMRTACKKIKFISPVQVPEYAGMARRHIYCNEETHTGFETLGEQQNENLGKDIASMDGQIVFKKSPIVYVPKLDSDTTNPVYMIDHETFYPVCLKGDYLRESKNPAPNQHNLTQYFVDLTYNFLCVNRRRNAVIYKV